MIVALADCGSPFTRRTFTGYKGVKYKAWVCRDRQLGRKGNGCMMRIIKETDLLAEICLQLGWEHFDEEGFTAAVERVVVSADGMVAEKVRQGA